ncbi:VOC family protein [Jiangella endophytica]|uniref:VOC family protein n=1 Tax=Jiangella endophytica TaxID=1623398 RepID=UPI00130022DC|nr:VOC family protein [Jiangella endophytica]
MPDGSVLRAVDAVVVRVPDLDAGLAFYRDQLGHELLWRHDAIGQAGLRLPGGESELVLATDVPPGPVWLVDAVEPALAQVVDAGGTVVSPPADVPVGRVAVVEDPFGNALVLIDLSRGRYRTDASGQVTGVAPPSAPAPPPPTPTPR